MSSFRLVGVCLNDAKVNYQVVRLDLKMSSREGMDVNLRCHREGYVNYNK